LALDYSEHLQDEVATIAFGKLLGGYCAGGARIFIKGDLGVGKTTLCRGILRAFGYEGAVKSPTFTLVEPYELAQQSIYHFDLYRLGNPNELEYIGIDEYFHAQNLCLVEWPERAADALPPCDVEVVLSVSGKSRDILLRSMTVLGEAVCQKVFGSLS
jgi:tRNA threonylcarbamoyladenosine biosynthesis protein TsaE|tara:strand:- start:27 stop:500 length:474 start_codon:yes stop_codon:yes gene_type:complete